MYCHFYFLHNLKLIFKTFPVRTSQASPIVGAFQNASKFFVVLLRMIFIFIYKKQRFGVLFFCTITLMQNSALGNILFYTHPSDQIFKYRLFKF